MAISGAHSVDVCFVTDEAVAVKRAVALASRTYGEDQMRERESEDARVVAGHGRARAQWRTAAMATTVARQCGLTRARLVVLAAREGGAANGGATCEVDWVTVLRW